MCVSAQLPTVQLLPPVIPLSLPCYTATLDSGEIGFPFDEGGSKRSYRTESLFARIDLPVTGPKSSKYMRTGRRCSRDIVLRGLCRTASVKLCTSNLEVSSTSTLILRAMIFETPRPSHIIALPTPMDEDDLDLPCPPAPYLPSCSNFHSPNPVSLSKHRLRFTQPLDVDCETPVFQQVCTGGLGLGGNMLGLFFDEKDRDKGVLQAAIERIEYDTRYSSVFEEEDEGERPQ